MKKKILCSLIVGLLLIAIPAWGKNYQYLSPEETSNKLTQQQPLTLVDIQVEEEFAQHHLPGALNTYAYPVKSAADKAKLDAILPQLKSSNSPVLIVCPRGGGGAKRAYDHLQLQGIPEERLFILEKGQQGWPYPKLLADD